MYLVIWEDGTIKKTKDISKEWFESVDNGDVGDIEIINISDPEKPMWYYQDGEWTEVETL